MGQSMQEELVDKIITCLTESDLNVQELGKKALQETKLSKELKKKTATEVVTWLRTSGINVDSQKFTIESLPQLLDSLTDQEKIDLVSYLLSKVILQTNIVSLVSSAFEAVSHIGTKYDDYVENFDAIKTRIENGVSDDIREVIMDRLKMLKPVRTSKINREFWNWVTGKDSDE